MANVSPVMEPNTREDLTTRRIRVFEKRYGTDALYLAYHAAFPLTLTSDLLYCLRENFVPDCPWYAVADVLLSGLCQPAGYDLYEMEGKTRDGLLRRLFEDKQFGKKRLNELADFMSDYINYRLQLDNNDRALVFGQFPEWTALAYVSSDKKEVINAIKQKLIAASNDKDRIRWAILAESYADLLAEQGFQLLQWSQQALDGQPIQDESTELAAAMGVTLEVFNFEVATITLENEPTEELQSFDFKTVTVNAQGKVVKRKKRQGFYFVELLGEKENSTTNYSQVIQGRIRELQQELSALFKKINNLENNLISETSPLERGFLRMRQKNTKEDIDRIEQELESLQLRQAELISIELEMVAIPGGTFVMGSPPDELKRFNNESPQHTVTVQPFFLGKYQITQAQWRFVAQLPQVKHKLDLDPSRFKGANSPVEKVSWDDAVEFCSRLSQYTGRPYRLPSEAEWEYACRAGTTTPFHFGETITTDLANYDGTNNEEEYKWSGSYGQGPKGVYRKETTDVGSFGVANDFGPYDMHGNVCEWCADYWHDNYEGAPTNGSAWLNDNDNQSRILRGGSWLYNPDLCRSAYRDNLDAGGRVNNLGFRVACSAA